MQSERLEWSAAIALEYPIDMADHQSTDDPDNISFNFVRHLVTIYGDLACIQIAFHGMCLHCSCNQLSFDKQ